MRFSPSFKLRVSAVVVFVLVFALGAVGAKGPKIVFKEEAWNFGKVKAGQELVHEFVFKNEGDAALSVKGVETSCGCTAAVVSDKKVEPGKTGKIKVSFNTQGYAGEVAKYIYVETDDPIQPRFQIKIAAAVDVPPQPRIDLDRYSYDGGLLVEGEDLIAPLTVFNKGELELKFECSLPGATFLFGGKTAAFPLKIASGKSIDITVKLPLDNRMGPIREFALFKSNDPLRSTISVNLSGYIVTKEQLKQIFQKYKDIIK